MTEKAQSQPPASNRFRNGSSKLQVAPAKRPPACRPGMNAIV